MIYLDLLFLLNFIYDFLLILTVKITLKRVASLKKMLLAAFIGALSIFLVVFNINSSILLILKFVVSIVMLFVAFGFKNVKFIVTNLLYLYMCSVILAGFLYYLDLEVSQNIIYFESSSISYIIILLIAPIILGLYIYQTKKLKQKQNLNYEVKIVFKNNKNLLLNGFIDSGNKLKCPITKKYIIIVNKKIYHNKNPIYVPFNGVNKTGIMECFSLKHIEINNQKFTNYLLGVSESKINLEGENCILNYKLMEDLNV